MLRSGSICTNLLYNYFITNEKDKDKKGDGGEKLNNKHNKLKYLSETFRNYGGVLAKISQILCSDEENNKVFSECSPYSQGKTVEFIKEEYNNNNILNNILEIDFDVYKSGSIGQVHKAIYKTGDDNIKDIVLKVQYVGLYDQVKTDLYILDMISKYLFDFTDLSYAMNDIKTKMYEELDYSNELKNQQLMHKIWDSHDKINVPEVIPEISTDKILGMDFIDAQDLDTFIKNASQEEKNNIAKIIIEFIFTNIFTHNVFYSDIHYGNFLIKENNLYIMDFGCLIKMEQELVDNLKNLYYSILNDDKELFYNTLENMKIINTDINVESKEYIYEYFSLQFLPWTTDDFLFTESWLEKSIYKKTELMKEWNLPSNLVYLNKIPFGLYHILTKIKANGNFKNIFDKILSK